jgi:hypothetical protein
MRVAVVNGDLFYENLMRIGRACALYCDTTLYFSLHLVAFGCIFKKYARQDLLIFQEAFMSKLAYLAVIWMEAN